jgi:hypothetical protein
MSELEARTAVLPDRWLLLIHQLPAKPAYLRVKVWRRLQALGAVAVKNAVYALPSSEQSQEDFEWLLKEIVEGGGEAMICEARLIDGLSDGEVRTLFDAARDTDYAKITEEARAIRARFDRKAPAETRAEARSQLARLKTRHAQIIAIDFFGADGRETADGLIAGLEVMLTEDSMPQPSTGPVSGQAGTDDLQGRVWVTRQGVHADRIACAWLIRRFIDERAAFKFVPPRGYVTEPGELRFDMFAAEFTHEGDRCSFEVLLARSGLGDPALTAIAEIVHDIDLKDGKFGREEASGIKMVIAGICADTRDDDQRLARGAAIFDDLYAVFRRKRGGTRADRR